MPSAPVSFVKLSIEFWNLTLFNCYAKEAEKFPQENVRPQNLPGHNTPSPAPDLIAAEIERQNLTGVSLSRRTTNGGTSTAQVRGMENELHVQGQCEKAKCSTDDRYDLPCGRCRSVT